MCSLIGCISKHRPNQKIQALNQTPFYNGTRVYVFQKIPTFNQKPRHLIDDMKLNAKVKSSNIYLLDTKALWLNQTPFRNCHKCIPFHKSIDYSIKT